MTALAIIEFDYNFETSDGVINNIELLRDKFPTLFKKETGELKSTFYIGEMIVDSSDMSFLSNLGIVYKVKRFKGVVPANVGSGLEDKGGIVQIHLPNYVLTSFNKVKVMEDCCTEELQRALDDNWRIIAVCPPLNQRRPDYVMAKVEH